MAFRKLQYVFSADGSQFDRTAGQMEDKADAVGASIGKWGAALGVGLGALGQFLEGMNEAIRLSEEVERKLDLALGGATPEARHLRDRLLEQGFTADVATAAGAAVAGRLSSDAAGNLIESGSAAEYQIAEMAAQFTRAGGDANAVLQTAANFGIGDQPAAIMDLMQATFAGAGAQNASLGTITGGVVALGPAASQLGLTARETTQLALDAESLGISPSSLNLPLQSALTKQAEEGTPALEYLRDIEEQIRDAPTEEAALAIAAPVYGSRGALLITRGIRQDRFGFGEQYLSDTHLEGSLGVGSIEATTEEILQAQRERGGLGAAGQGITKGVSGFINEIPLVGGLLGTVVDPALEAHQGFAARGLQRDEPNVTVRFVIEDSTIGGIKASQKVTDSQSDGRTVGESDERPPAQ